jgi:hypothetical protein
MGIKNIHIVLISCSVLIALIFGIWALKNNYAILGYVSLSAAVGLVVYGIKFLKKVKGL